MSILSIQSSVTHGHVGNSAATFVWQRLGFNVWAVPTVLLSNHPGYDSYGGDAVPVQTIKGVIDGLETHNHFDHCEAIVTGYPGNLDHCQLVKETIKRVRKFNPNTPYFCDPVLGDEGKGLYVPKETADFIRDELISMADFVTPNLFELEYLTGRVQNSLADTLFAADMLRDLGPTQVLISSFREIQNDREYLCNILVNDSGAWKISMPKQSLRAKGTGDVLTALFMAHVLRGEKLKSALELASSSLYGIIDDTVRHDQDELRLIGAQAEFLNPSYYFDAVRVG